MYDISNRRKLYKNNNTKEKIRKLETEKEIVPEPISTKKES
jgi:hypothetical protein